MRQKPFCVQTLKHPDKRAAYDAIVGLSGNAINPFTDTTFERDQVSCRSLRYSSCLGSTMLKGGKQCRCLLMS